MNTPTAADFTPFVGRTGYHCDLAEALEAAGFFVVADPDDAELSHVFLDASVDDDKVGEIVGDSEAAIRAV